MSGGRVAVIGAAGVIGSRFVERLALAGRGERVVGVVRSWSSAVALARYGVDLRRADVELGSAGLIEALAGVEAVVDLTYPKRSDPPRDRERLAALMATSVVESARAVGARRLVHLGSISSYGPLAEPVHSEGSPSRPSREDGYGRAKLAATETVLAAARKLGLEAIVLEPTVVYGPGTGWSGGTLGQLRKGRVVLPEPGDGHCPAVYLDDVCCAIEAALEAGPEACGRRYLINGPEPLLWREFFVTHGEIAGAREACCVTRTAAELSRGRSHERRMQGPFRRLFALLRQDASVRGAVLALPGPAQARSIARAALSERRWQHLRRRLVSSQGSRVESGDSVEFRPTPVQEALFSWRGQIDDSSARGRLRYSPMVPFSAGLELLAAWAQWAGLAADLAGGGE